VLLATVNTAGEFTPFAGEMFAEKPPNSLLKQMFPRSEAMNSPTTIRRNGRFCIAAPIQVS
jgi:hypothetical protein